MPSTYSHPRNKHWLAVLTSANMAPALFGIAALLTYAVLPVTLYFFVDLGSSFFELAGITVVAVAAMFVGAQTPLFDAILRGKRKRIYISYKYFNFLLWSFFLAFILTAWITAPGIPIIAALTGADSATIAVLREEFLKAREGWEASLVYINALLSGALLPYSLALMFLRGMPYRWFAAGIFLVYCISFVEKAFFFKLALPLLYLVAQGRAKTKLSPQMMVIGMVIILFIVTLMSGSGTLEIEGSSQFFSVGYIPTGPVDHLVWRSIAIPLITAADSIRVLNENYGGQHLLGATSNLLAGILGMDRIAFEREVFAAQWGQNETGTGSANAVFFTEAYVNFGWIGVMVFGFVVGLILRFFAVSRDEAFRAVWPLFAFGVYTSGLIGMLFSNGFIFLLLLVMCVKLERPTRAGMQASRKAKWLDWFVLPKKKRISSTK